MERNAHIAELELALADIKKRWPAHSVKPELINEMEKLEEELAKLKDESIGGKVFMSTIHIQVLGSRMMDQCNSGG